MKILEATITNPYRSHKPKGFYHPLRGYDLPAGNIIDSPKSEHRRIL